MTVMPNSASENVPGLLAEALSACGLDAVMREAQQAGWNAAVLAAPYVPVDYTEASIDYQLAYQRGHGGDWTDCSMVLKSGGRAVAVWPFSISFVESGYRIGSFGQAVLAPLFCADASSVTRKKIVAACLGALEFLGGKLSVPHWECADPWISDASFSQWHLELMSRGWSPRVHHDLYVDLSPDLDRIRTNFRKSYRSLVTSGARHWQVGLLIASGPEEWAEFRQLHLAVAGRVTRSDESWNIQHEQISDGQAFLVYLRDTGGSMVGGGLFSYSRDEGTYSVGAYDRSLFDKPLGHVVQYHAIAEMKRRGLSWYKVGRRAYASDTPVPTQKEITISEFKQGFASHVFPAFCLQHHHRVESPLAVPTEAGEKIEEN